MHPDAEHLAVPEKPPGCRCGVATQGLSIVGCPILLAYNEPRGAPLQGDRSGARFVALLGPHVRQLDGLSQMIVDASRTRHKSRPALARSQGFVVVEQVTSRFMSGEVRRRS